MVLPGLTKSLRDLNRETTFPPGILVLVAAAVAGSLLACQVHKTTPPTLGSGQGPRS